MVLLPTRIEEATEYMGLVESAIDELWSDKPSGVERRAVLWRMKSLSTESACR